MNKNNQDIGYVLSVTPYREHDAMIHFFGRQYGLIRFVLSGYYKPQSKQSSLGVEFSMVRLRFQYKENQLMRIQTGELLETYYEYRQEYDWLLLMSLVTEILIKLYQSSAQSFWLTFIESSYQHPSYTQLIYNLRDVIVDLGIEPVVDRCVITHSTQVSDFSIERGGFVSKKYRTSKLQLHHLQTILFLFTKTKETLSQVDDEMIILDILVRYIEFHMDVKFNSWKLIYDV